MSHSAVDKAVLYPGPHLILTVMPILAERSGVSPRRRPDLKPQVSLLLLCWCGACPLIFNFLSLLLMPSVLFKKEHGTAAQINIGSEVGYRVSWTVASPIV